MRRLRVSEFKTNRLLSNSLRDWTVSRRRVVCGRIGPRQTRYGAVSYSLTLYGANGGSGEQAIPLASLELAVGSWRHWGCEPCFTSIEERSPWLADARHDRPGEFANDIACFPDLELDKGEARSSLA